MLYHCDICDHWQNTRKIETPFGKSPVPYVAAVDDLSGSKGYACANCVANEIDTCGKFSAYRNDRHSMGTALVLYAWSMMSSEDDYMTNEGWGYCGQFGRYLLFTDTQGFVTYDDCDTVMKAGMEFERLYIEGWGASEFDAYISDDRGRYAVSIDGKYVATVDRFNRARAMVRLEAWKSGEYPNLWHSTERGNLEMVTY